MNTELELQQEVLRICEAGERGCLATLVRSSGSVPMSRRAKMLVRADGTTLGTVGGGCLEREVWACARDVIRGGGPQTFRCSLSAEDVLSGGLVCGGTVDVFLQPVGGAAMAGVYRQIGALLAEGGRAVLATVVASGDIAGVQAGDLLLVGPEGAVLGGVESAPLRRAVSAEASCVLREGVPRLYAFAPGEMVLAERPPAGAPGTGLLFLEPVAPAPTLYLFGGGHVGLATAQIAALVGLRVVVVDDREAFANRERFPWADEVVVAGFGGVFEQLRVDESSYVVCVTRGHQYDEVVVEQALRTPAGYIGMIGSRRKVALLFDRLRARGASEADLARVHAPIGLEIGADTPEEIAVSIVAQIIAVRREAAQRAGSRGGKDAGPFCRS